MIDTYVFLRIIVAPNVAFQARRCEPVLPRCSRNGVTPAPRSTGESMNGTIEAGTGRGRGDAGSMFAGERRTLPNRSHIRFDRAAGGRSYAPAVTRISGMRPGCLRGLSAIAPYPGLRWQTAPERLSG